MTIKKPEQYLRLCFFILLGIAIFIIRVPDIFSQEAAISYKIPYIQSTPVIDGEISRGEWDNAEVVYLDNETEPSQNIPALVDTEVLMMEDGINFYLAFIAYDPRPEEIRAFYGDRDSCQDDDLIGVVIDTFNDGRRAFQFFANPLGVQMDSICDDVVESEDSSWNAIWGSAGKITEKGYVVEMEIPLNQLRFPTGLEQQTWGMDLIRYYPRSKRHRLTNNTRNYALSCYLCQLEKIHGFARLEENLNFRFVPSVTGSYSENRPSPETDEWKEDLKFDAGMDIRWGINQNTYLNATINPDFSQVEADVAQVDVNNTFSLFYPERREFFLEGADYFNTHSNLVYTRNIYSPDYGIKLTGKQDIHAYGFFYANDESTTFLIPGNQGSSIASLEGLESRNTALRYNADVSSNINLGTLLTDRRADEYSNTLAGIDGSIRIGESDRIDMQLMKSYSEYPRSIQVDFDQKARIDDFAYLFDYEHDDSRWFWNARYADFGNDFRADMGFINRVDVQELNLAGGYFWRFGPENKINRIHYRVTYEESRDESGNKLNEAAGMGINAYGPMQSYMLITYNQGERFYNGKFFDEYTLGFIGRITPWAGVEFSVESNFGDSIDFVNTRPGRMLSIAPQLDLRIGKYFQAGLQHNFQQMDVNGGRLYRTNLSDLRFTYQFTIRSFLRVTVQYSDTQRNQSLYIFDADRRSKDITSQILYSYKINPQTRFFIGYSDTGLQNDALGELSGTQRTLFTKISYAWEY